MADSINFNSFTKLVNTVTNDIIDHQIPQKVADVFSTIIDMSVKITNDSLQVIKDATEPKS
jgi:hypothetical protein